MSVRVDLSGMGCDGGLVRFLKSRIHVPAVERPRCVEWAGPLYRFIVICLAKTETALLPAPFWCTSRGPAHFDWRWRKRPALALLAWDTCSIVRLCRVHRDALIHRKIGLNAGSGSVRPWPRMIGRDTVASRPFRHRSSTALSGGSARPAQAVCVFRQAFFVERLT